MQGPGTALEKSLGGHSSSLLEVQIGAALEVDTIVPLECVRFAAKPNGEKKTAVVAKTEDN